MVGLDPTIITGNHCPSVQHALYLVCLGLAHHPLKIAYYTIIITIYVFLFYYMFLNIFKKKYSLHYFESLVGFRIFRITSQKRNLETLI